ncbi:hypothetical protein ACFP81_11240 [Deinococcus lacus]|uniref:Bacterial surface antigen (D15) domain-containing protein n=1 Tax=Deinococcus lacus TaxID=392561 RepID=A0ABW1YDY1_9DEIO
MTRLSLFSLARGAALLALLSPAAQAQAPAPSSPFGVQFPPDYLGRLGGTEPVASSESGFGVRNFPLPFSVPVSISLVKKPNYWETSLNSRVDDTTYGIGIYDNGLNAKEGLFKVVADHDPWEGWQYGAMYQNQGALSRVNLGYAALFDDRQLRLLGNVGLGAQGDLLTPYGQLQATRTFSVAKDNYNLRTSLTGRVFAYPVAGKAQGSLDTEFGATVRPVPQLNLSATHLERFVVGEAALSAQGFSRYQESNLDATYRLPTSEAPLEFGALRSRLTQYWTSEETALRGDLLFKAEGLPSLIGPTVGYRWSKNAEGAWLFGITSLPR